MLEAFDDVDGGAAVQMEAHAGVPGEKRAGGAGDDAYPLALACADVDVAGDDLVGLGKVGSGLIGEPHNLLGAPAQVETALGRGDASGVTAIWRESAGWVTCSTSAARDMVPSWHTVRK